MVKFKLSISALKAPAVRRPVLLIKLQESIVTFEFY